MPNAAFQFISVNGTSAKDRTAEGVLPAPGLWVIRSVAAIAGKRLRSARPRSIRGTWNDRCTAANVPPFSPRSGGLPFTQHTHLSCRAATS